jgi:plasmid stabilization system protein ParE
MRVRIIEPAKDDLKSAARYYDSQQAGLGRRFLHSLRAEIRSLQATAGIHARDFGCQRVLARDFPYAIFYRVDGGIAIVLAVLDLRRDPEWIQRTLGRR